MALKLDTVGVKEAKPITKQVDESKHYNVAIQLGCRRRWRQYGGGRWAEDPANNRDGRKAYKHIPAVHKVGPLAGSVVNGLIESHNQFLEANHNNVKPDGDVGRMLLVLDVESTAPPQLRSAALPFDLESLVTRVAEASATAAVTAMMRAGGK